MKIVNFLKYQLLTFFKGSSFIMPLVATTTCMYFMYSVKPLKLLSSILASGFIIFFIMVWIGMSLAQNEKVVEEQILFLKMGKDSTYYSGKIIFLATLSLLMAFIYTIVPIVINVINGHSLFQEFMGIYEIVNIFLLHLGEALIGVTVGNFLSPRFIKDRKLAIVLTVMVAVVGLTVKSIGEKWPLLRLILWLFPPVTLPAEIYGTSYSFQLGQTFILFFIMMIYASVCASIKSIICKKVKW